MGDVINLNKFRKQKARAEKEAQAAENRISHGRTKAEKRRAKDDEARREQLLNDAQLDPQKHDDRDAKED